MTESLTSSGSVSRQIFAELRTALDLYAKNKDNANKKEETEDTENAENAEKTNTTKTRADRSQITRKVLKDIQKTFPQTVSSDVEQEMVSGLDTDKDMNTTEQIQFQAEQVKNFQSQQANAVKIEVKQFNLPKNTDAIISEIKRNGLNRTMSAYQIADKYKLSYMKAREILDKMNTDSNGFIREYKLPENSTVSFKV